MNCARDPDVKENEICYKTADTRTGEEPLPQERAGNLIAIENEGRIPKLPTVYRLIHSLHISADRIFYPEQPPKDSERAQLTHMLESCSDRDLHILLCAARAMLQEQ